MKTHYYQIVPECYADTVLVEMLGFKNPNHQLSIGTVFGEFSKNLRKRKAVGIIDDDKKKPKSLDEFELIEERYGIKRLRKDKHTILMICPAFEGWIFENANAKNVDPAQYGFKTRKDFQKACKRTDVGKNDKVKQFLNTINQKEAPGFIQLRDWICEAADIDPADLR